MASVEDVIDAISLINQISATTKTNTEQRILDFYAEYVEGHEEGVIVENLLRNTTSRPSMKGTLSATAQSDPTYTG